MSAKPDPLIPFQVQVPNTVANSTISNVGRISFSEAPIQRAIFKYKNEEGRKKIIDTAKVVHHDFGQFNETLAVSVTTSDLESLKSDPDLEWFEGDGRVIYCSIR
mmetsp:Transcript_8681/g.18540  ORF Transcript_8681/g.18540 Transcript_8681/m.18540 type:complete len:105 (-) Transcript_8681:248-562(-)|eukprot:CAMPEP_0171336484 /NCGR_PEP_ID=MMETSP0878-20121228/6069_1 /TAXON_ID=67004 /ORGANISM="Thalassiosira weissflogii, Strain CCMP1336" /LENGTH=104 /DNA_ID=CAMNT_0011837967 /DNA_START=214 /DNA_END=528 /DNA_ORIENTATION=-